MKFGMINSEWGEHPDIKQLLTEIRDTGWDGCEMRLTLDWMGCPERMKNIIGETGCEIFCLATELGPPDPNHLAMELIRRRIEYAAAIDVKNVMIFPPARTKGRAPFESEYNKFAEAAEKLAEYALGFGINLSYHHHTDHLIERVREVEVVFEQTNILKLCLDIYHTTILGDDFIKTFKFWKDRIHYIHLHDGNGIKLLDLGEGSLQISPALEALKKSGYEGWVVVHGGTTDRSPIEKSRVCREYLKSIGL